MKTVASNKLELLRAMVDTYQGIQEERIRAENRLRAISKGMDESDPLREKFLERLTQLKRLENAIARDAQKELNGIPVYDKFLKHVRGLGAVLSAKLLALPLRLGVNLSSWYAYFGLTPHYYKCECKAGHKFLAPKVRTECPVKTVVDSGEPEECKAPVIRVEHIEHQSPRRLRGYKIFWNPKARVIAFLIGRSFMMKRGFYHEKIQEFYKRFSQREDLKNAPKGRLWAMAQRAATKLFIAHYYQASHELEGIPYRLPYAFEYLKHEHFISWQEVVEIEKRYEAK